MRSLFIYICCLLIANAGAMVASVTSRAGRPIVGRVRTAAEGPVEDADATSGLHRSVRPRVEVATAPVGHPAKAQFKIATYNILCGRRERMVSALRAIEQLNVDIALLTEVKVTGEAYTRYSHGYNVKASKASSAHCGGVALCWRDSDIYQVEGTHIHGPNVISFELVTGHRRWLVIGAYIPPSEDDGSTCEHMLAAQQRRPRLPTLVIGDLNVDLSNVRIGDNRAAGIAATVALLGVKDMCKHFRSRRSNPYDFTWSQKRNGVMIRSRCDYILSDESKYFSNVRIVKPRLYDSDHSAVVATMIPAPAKQHLRYLNGRKAFPLRVLARNMTQLDRMFEDIQPPPTVPEEAAARGPGWVSEQTWQLVDQRVMGKRDGSLTPRNLKLLNSRIRRSFRRDRLQRSVDAGTEIEARLVAGDIRGSWGLLKRWYKHSSGKAPKPSYTDFAELGTVYLALYSATQPPGDPLPIRYLPVPVLDDVPSEVEIAMSVEKLRSGKAPGPSGLKVDQLKVWRAQEDQTDWLKLVALVQHCFTTGQLPKKLCFSTLVLIPKSDGGVRGIGLLESVWKIISMIMKERMQGAIQFDDALHGFLPRRGTGTAILEARLRLDYSIQQGRTLYQVYLDLSKAYDTLDRGRTLQLLQGYGVGPRMLGLLNNFWNKLQLVPRQSGFYGAPISSDRGVTQGDPLSPIIFNVVVDAVVRELRATAALGTLSTLFYADDGWVAGLCPLQVQQGVDTLENLFSRMGLVMNPTKTKAMIGHPGVAVHVQSSPAYRRRLTGDGGTYLERIRQETECPECGKMLQQGTLARHMLSQHDVYQRPRKRQRLMEQQEQNPVTYRISHPGHAAVRCPVPGCAAAPTSRQSLRVHFSHRHVRDVIIIEEEGAFPRCGRCDMFVSPASISTSHPNSKMCVAGTERKRKRLLELEHLRNQEVVFTVSGNPIETVDSFRYLGRPVTADSKDGMAVLYNIHRTRRRWAQVNRLLARQGANSKVSGYFYKAVCQSVLLYGCETWVVSDQILRSLDGFHHRVARRLTHRHTRFDRASDTWIVPAADLSLERASLKPMSEYILRRRFYLLNWAQDRPMLQQTRFLNGGAGGPNRSYWWSNYPGDM